MALEDIDKHYPTEPLTHIYTDGSAEDTTRNGGCGTYFKRSSKPSFSLSDPVGHCAQTTDLKS